MADKSKDIIFRFFIVYFIICCCFVAVIVTVLRIYTERDKWIELGKISSKGIEVKPARGNIYSATGQLMASSVPSYYLYVDLTVPALTQDKKARELFYKNIDSLTYCLSKFLRDKSPMTYRKMFVDAYKKGDREFEFYTKRVSYEQLKTIKTFPLFRLGRNKSGLFTKEMYSRIRPYGELALRTIGDIYADEMKGGKSGLELYFNDSLKGIPGKAILTKVANRYEQKVVQEPLNGCDIHTTIDESIQDFADKSLRASLKKFNANSGYVILMETQSGDIKAMVNLQKASDSTYQELHNGAVSDLVEPGSTFKIISTMIALDEDKASLSDKIDTQNGQKQYGPIVLKDHNWQKNGSGVITLAQAIYMSSNIGVASVIERAYGHNQSHFVDQIKERKLDQKLDIEIPGIAKPYFPHPKDKNAYWSTITTLPWLAIGYNCQVPPIYTLAYFNAIANNGKYIQPRLVTSISRNGVCLDTFPTVVINERICKESTIELLKGAMVGVLTDKIGTAKNVKSDFFSIAGKTGTALISKGKGGYSGEDGRKHQVSFCGFFPVENPMYTLIVVIREPSIGYPSGGVMAGSVFKEVAEAIMIQNSLAKPDVLLKDTLAKKMPFFPQILTGSRVHTNIVLDYLNLPRVNANNNWVSLKPLGNKFKATGVFVPSNLVPNLQGMGAKDAVYLAERLGLRVQVLGRGKIVSQSIKEGSIPKKGELIVLRLE